MKTNSTDVNIGWRFLFLAGFYFTMGVCTAIAMSIGIAKLFGVIQ